MNNLLTLSVRESSILIKTANQSRFVFEERNGIVLLEAHGNDFEKLLRIELKCSQSDKVGNARIELTKEEVLKLIHFAISEFNIRRIVE